MYMNTYTAASKTVLGGTGRGALPPPPPPPTPIQTFVQSNLEIHWDMKVHKIRLQYMCIIRMRR
jgi:hypothetical protein